MAEEPAQENTNWETEMQSAPKTVKVELSNGGGGMPILGKLSHVLATLVAAVIALAVSAVLADGMSVIKLKDIKHLPIVTQVPDHFKYRLDELMGPTYGIGLHHDQSGRSWTSAGAGESLKEIVANLGMPAVAGAVPYVVMTDDLKHPVPLLRCDDLQMAGLAAMSFGFIAEVVAAFMVLFHALALADLLPSKAVKPLAGLVWLTLSIGFLVVILLAVGIFVATWKCDNNIIPSIKLSDHFDYNYGFPFAIIGYTSALLVFCVMLVFTSTPQMTFTSSSSLSPSSPPPEPAEIKKGLIKVIAGITTGWIIAGCGSLIILGSNGVLDKVQHDDINICAGQQPVYAGIGDSYFANTKCMIDSVAQTLEQAGANVTRGFQGLMDSGNRQPIKVPYTQTDLCPVNVHWHLGAEHYSAGQFDGNGKGPAAEYESMGPFGNSSDDSSSASSYSGRRELAGKMRLGYRCHHYDEKDIRWTNDYHWKYCTDMKIGETYEIHWPHSAAGACGTKHQYQTPFYDGVFCRDGIISLAPLNTYEKIGVQGQVFTIINDDSDQYYYPDLIKGMWVDGLHGVDMATYTGSTTGTSRDNNMCSRYTPITWQVDRKCHVISAKSFDKLCADMIAMEDDMSADLHPHGARALVLPEYSANNQKSMTYGGRKK